MSSKRKEFFLKFIYLGGGAERERERIPSRLCTVSTEPDVALEFANSEITT